MVMEGGKGQQNNRCFVEFISQNNLSQYNKKKAATTTKTIFQQH